MQTNDADTTTVIQGITLDEYSEIVREIDEQPIWRSQADREMDYADGNQLDSDLLQKQQALGIPPAVEDLIGPAMRSLAGFEIATRTDWRVTPNGSMDGGDVADAINFKLNLAERESKADKAMTDAFRPQSGCGMGWVEVSRESNPFKFPYRAIAVHRNEMHWDMKALEPDLSDARWLRRKRWIHPDRLVKLFPKHAETIRASGRGGNDWWVRGWTSMDGGQSTGLRNASMSARAWTLEEDRWYNPTSKEVCLVELWYRRWEEVGVIIASDGRVVEYDENNIDHNYAIASGMLKYTRAVIPRVRMSYWLGPAKLYDGPTPYKHEHFPYVPFWGFREDTTRITYGFIRSMMYQQDAVNSGVSKLRWGMSVVRTERTKGVVDMTDAQFRRQIARADADIVLNATEMAKPGARFDVKRDYTLSDQHFQLLNDNRAAIERVSSITAGFSGRSGTARSGVQESTQVEQTNQSLQSMMDNFRFGRRMVAELLMSMIIEDIGEAETEVLIEGDAIRPDRVVVLNQKQVDGETGVTYLTNDVMRTRLKVALEDVPSTNSYRAQQLNAMSEAVKSLPAQYQVAVMPFMVSLMDVPFKKDVVEAIRAAGTQESPEAVEQRIKQAVQDALIKAGNDLKSREIDLKERKTNAEITALIAKAVETGVQSAYSAMQAGQVIATMPQVAPVADAIMQGAGYTRPSSGGDDPNFPVPEGVDVPAPAVRQNTSPAFPPVPAKGDSPMTGIETATPADNFTGANA